MLTSGFRSSSTVLFLALACNNAGGTPSAPLSSAAPLTSVAGSAEGRRIDIGVTDAGFSPSTIELKQGEKAVLRFTRTTKSECLKAISIPELKISQDLPVNTPVEVPVSFDKKGTFVLQCWMAMVKATIEVK